MCSLRLRLLLNLSALGLVLNGCSLLLGEPTFAEDDASPARDAGAAIDARVDAGRTDSGASDAGRDAGACPMGCPATEPHCDEAAARCVECLGAAHCDDGNDCTLDACTTARTCTGDPAVRDGMDCDGAAGVCAEGSCIAHRWSTAFGDTENDIGYSIAIDAAGNACITGSFRGSVDFGGGVRVSAGSEDGFVASYGPDGSHRWSRRFGAEFHDRGSSIGVDALGNSLITGTFRGEVDFGGGPLVAAADDVFIASYTSGGSHRWSQRFDVGGGAWALAVDAAGNAYITGYYNGSADFGGDTFVGSGAYLASYTSDGTHRWSQAFEMAGAGAGLAVDRSGNVYVTGQLTGSADFGGGTLVSDGTDVFVASFQSDGEHRWSQRFGVGDDDRGSSLATDDAGNLYVLGYFTDSVIDFGGGPLRAARSLDVFVASFTSGGVHRWSRAFGGPSLDDGSSLAVDGAGNVYFTGRFAATADFGGTSLMSAGGDDIFLASLTSAGDHRWSRRYGDVGYDEALGLAVDDSGGVWLTGYFETQAYFGGPTLMSAGSLDGFVLSLGP